MVEKEKTRTHLSSPEWSVAHDLKELVGENGKPTFELVHVPEKEPYTLSEVAYTFSDEELRLPPEVAERKESLIAERKKVLAQRYQDALGEWEQSGRVGEEPPEPSFFDGPLVRVLPRDTFITTNRHGGPLLVNPLGRTSYYDYVATRDLDQTKYGIETMALPLAMCGVLIGTDAGGQPRMIYTVRTTKPEAYSGCFHVMGGMLVRPRWEMANPTRAWIKELLEEAGVEEGEVKSLGLLGLVMDTHWPHPEITHMGRLATPLEEIFDRDGVELTPQRPTDKEVFLRSVPWGPDIIRGLAVGEKVAGGDSDLRPWVPTGLANLLLAGRVDFGEEWFNETMAEYQEKISRLTPR